MQSTIRLTRKVLPRIENEVAREYSTRVAVRLSKNAMKNHANDGTGKHPHVCVQKCALEDCENKKCTSVCDQPTNLDIDGHNTHIPPIGRISRYIAEEDAHGNPLKQYFVPTNTINTITEQQKQNYGKDVKADPLTQAFIEKYKDKYE